MKLNIIGIRNFRRLENVEFNLEDDNTVFVGPNNSGKTSAASIFRLFLKDEKFTVHDFTVSSIAILNKFGLGENVGDEFPSIDLDLWFSINPEVEFGRVFTLLPSVSADIEEVGIRLCFCAKDPEKLKSDYDTTFPANEKKGEARRTLAHFLTLSGNLTKHFGVKYYSLERTKEGIAHGEIEPDEGRRVIRSLIRVDFVDAQRNIHDKEESRSNKLSAAFAAYYRKNLEKPDVNEAANKIIDENNQKLTEHYDTHFEALLQTIAQLGVPSVHDRKLRLISSLSPQEALQGNTELYYVDDALGHELPEAYNGLGFKNLVYMAIQVSHFHTQWMATEKDRELCQLIFIEEPEVHLHAQVQQTFISNIWSILHQASKVAGEPDMVPQLAISTHSSHVLDTVEFAKVRYFRRCALAKEDPSKTKTLNSSVVLSLRDFKPKKESAGGKAEDEEETLKFLKQYLKLTHCDLFFADGAVLVEGTVEKLLLPQMIEKTAAGLRSRYLSILEVGGAYAHRFASLLEFLGIKYLVVTDIDSVEPKDNRKACRADTKDAVTSNASLKFFFDKKSVKDFNALGPKDHILGDGSCFVTFQKPEDVEVNNKTCKMHGRTLEEMFVYENLEFFQKGELEFADELPNTASSDEITQIVYDRIRASSFKKTEFSLSVLSSLKDWVTPNYIAMGLRWLEEVLVPAVNDEKPAQKSEG